MPEVAVVMPTHAHPTLIRFALDSVLAQTVTDLVVLVVGDGADERTDEVVTAVAASDDRVTWLPHPKGEGHGERWRHAALQDVDADFVAYCADDDLWTPTHVAELREGLQDADFGHTLHLAVRPDQPPRVLPSDLGSTAQRRRMLQTRQNYFGLSCAGHTMAAYRGLPAGWRPKPTDIWSDLHMWRQFLGARGLRHRTVPSVSTIAFPSPSRLEWEPGRREAEIAGHAELLRRPGLRLSDELTFQPVLIREAVRWRERALNEADRVAALEAQLAMLLARQPPDPDGQDARTPLP